uniref:Bifunctional NAD(P)H-hydrate repair enzyme n=1 Tax=Caldicellulosiruptor owensensis TaxID=55205 RepID=A0A7C5V3P8_9FIRM
MFVLTSSQMREIDRKASQEIGIPEVVLMENAGFCVFEEIKKDFEVLKDKNIAVFCGKGNNGGDGFVVARYLAQVCPNVKVFLFDENVTLTSKVFLDILKRLEVDVKILSAELLLSLKSQRFDIIVDAIFGIGLSKDIDGLYKKAIEYINNSNAYVYSVDIPSGICSDTAQVKGCAVRASKTVTFVYPKIGHILYPGSYYCGKVVVKDIGIPEKIIKDIKVKILTAEDLDVSKFYRYPDSHKGDYGKVGIVAGSRYYPGAAVLCSNAAIKSGCGLCYLITPQETLYFQSLRKPEIIVLPVESKEGVISFDGFVKFKEYFAKLDVLGFGCGLTRDSEVEKILIHILESFQIPIVIDADGLNVLASSQKAKNLLASYKSQKVLTPHYMEAARLLGVDVKDVAKNPVDAATKVAREFEAICVLKGSRTIITDGDKVFINVLGNPGMAKGGSGDVLTGIILSMIAQGYSAFEAAKISVYLHSLSADILLEKKTMQTILPSDIIEGLDSAIRRLIEG